MTRTRSAAANLAIVGVLGLALAAGPAAASRLPLYGGLARCTPTVQVPPGGATYCLAIAETPTADPIYVLAARILSGRNQLVSQFGYGFSAAPGVVSVGYYAEESTTSFSSRSRYCQVIIDPADAALAVDFSVHVDGVVVAAATEKDLGPCPTNNGRQP
jgi:hypothetical protein